MGPGCGTALINGIAVGLMSSVNRGAIGVVGASGSGLQEIASLVHREGLGISQAIGTGGRDLSESVGGVTMLQGLKFLEADKSTEVIVLVSKPPAEKTMKVILQEVSVCRKPVVINFLGGDEESIRRAGAIPAFTLEDAALKAVSLVKGVSVPSYNAAQRKERLRALADEERRKLTSSQKYLRGLFCGGTHCEEAILILREFINNDVYSNVPLESCIQLKDVKTSHCHSIIDMGGEEFTIGKPHPVIDPSMVKDRLLKEGADSEVAVVLLDIILGYGAHSDPAGVVCGAIHDIKEKARQDGRHLSVVVSVCGTDRDPQGLALQEEKLRQSGAIVMPSNAQASILSALIASL